MFHKNLLMHLAKCDSFWMFSSRQEIVTHTKKPELDFRLIAKHPGFQLRRSFFSSLFLNDV